MTGAELVSVVGRPPRIDRHPDGSADWFYRFAEEHQEGRPLAEAETSDTEASVSIGYEVSSTTTINEAPVRLSPGGRVVGAIPGGRVVVE